MSLENLSSLVSGDTWDVPNNWEWVSISQVSSIVSGGTPSTKVEQYYNGDIPWITPADMSTHQGIYIENGRRNITQYGLENSSAQILPKGTVLFSSRAPIGYVAIAANEVTTNQGFKSFIPEESISSKFLYYWLILAKPFAEKLASGTTFLEISGSKSALLPFPLAPEHEQNRIVDKLEELFSELDSGVEELKAAQVKLTQYRQSLLKSAVEGSLTQQWREANSGNIQETGAQLLERILTERREHWEEQKLAEFKAKDKKPPKNWQAKYPELAAPDTSNLPELPDGWVWATIDQLAISKRYGSSSKTNDDSSGVPVLRMGNIQDGKLDYGNLKYLPSDHKEFPELLLNDGDLLFNRTNSAELVGKTAIYRDIGKPVSYASYLISVTFSKHVLPEIAAHYINSVLGKKWVAEVMNQTAGQANVNGTKLGHLAIPLPPSAEQKVLLDEISNEFDSIDRQVEATELGLKQSEAQRKNILKSAFSGQLVPQDPNDEPASVLLEKIKQEREALVRKPKTKQIKTKSAMKKITVEELTKWVSDYEENSFTFGELQKTFQGDYDQLKDCVFEILSAKEPILKQVFDQKLNAITFIKED